MSSVSAWVALALLGLPVLKHGGGAGDTARSDVLSGFDSQQRLLLRVGQSSSSGGGGGVGREGGKGRVVVGGTTRRGALSQHARPIYVCMYAHVYVYTHIYIYIDIRGFSHVVVV